MSNAIGPLTAVGFMSWVIWLLAVTWRRSRVLKAQTNLRSQILDKIGSSGEMLEFMKLDAGQKMLEPLQIEPAEPAAPKGYGRILRAVQVGIVLTLLGAGFLVAPIQSDRDAATVIATLLLSLGLGFLLAGLASYMLSKSWGLINGEQAN